MLLSCPVSGRPCVQTKSSHPLLINNSYRQEEYHWFSLILCTVGLQTDDDRPAFMCSRFTMSSANLRNFSKSYLLSNPVQYQPHCSPCPLAIGEALSPGEPSLCLQHCRGVLLAGSGQCRDISGCSLAWKCLSLAKAFPVFSSCLEDHPVCVSLKLNWGSFSFSFPLLIHLSWD